MLNDVLSAFANLSQRAKQIANSEFARLGSQPAYDDSAVDMGDLADEANDRGVAFYETMYSLRQTTLNLVAAGLFHLIEQHLANLCDDGAFTVDPPKDTKLDVLNRWYIKHFRLDLRSLGSWSKVDELRHVANAIKHAEGPSAKTLRRLRPSLFVDPAMSELDLHMSHEERTVRMPLAGDDLYITQPIFEEYQQAAKQLFADIAHHFEAHGEKGFG